MYYKTEEELDIIRENCMLVSKVLAHVASVLKPGMTGVKLDEEAEALIRDHKADPAFKGYNGFPNTLCISINEQVVHGIPSKQEFRDGDIVSVDCGVYANEYYGDAAYTFALGEIDEDTMELLWTTREALDKGISQAVAGNRLGDISFAIQSFAENEHGFGVVRELVGHGLGRELHEAPEVPNYGRRGSGPLLKSGLVLAIEPMINMGRKEVMQSEDGWTILTRDRKPAAHYEHTIVVREQEAERLSDHRIVEEALKKNPHLEEISEKN
jgi:methionyl aminopeptidase